MSEEIDDQALIDEQLEELDRKSESLFQQCRIRSALRLTREVTSTAKAKHRAVHYMRGLFDQMRFGHGLLDPTITREASVELIALLESEEQARRIQPDLDEQHYHWVCSWMSSCAYDNLAESTARMSGYNSPGLHDCITDGIQVCRRTGKLDCIKCFREYAADVYLAADDLDMVRVQCQALLEYRGDDKERKDRRWSSHHKLAWIELLEGRLDKAEEELLKAEAVTQEKLVYLKMRSQLLVLASQNEVRLLSGLQPIQFPSRVTTDEGPAVPLPEAGEWPRLEMELAKLEALAATIQGDYPQAIEILTDWDRRLTQQQCLHDWFEIRLRLIALYRLAGKPQRAQALTKGLDAQARESQDYLTLRRLARLNDDTLPVNPLATLAGLNRGPFAEQQLTSASAPLISNKTSAETNDEQRHSPEKSPSPKSAQLDELAQELVLARTDFSRAQQESDGDEALIDEAFDRFRQRNEVVLKKLLGFSPGELSDPRDAAQIVHLLQFLIGDSETARQCWNYARDILHHFENAPLVLNVVAALGHYFLKSDPEAFEDQISPETLTTWFRKSLQLDPDHPRSHLRAGEFFRERGELGEAERILARAFRLKRDEPQAALSLAEVYQDTERPRDALSVLDLCLREGGDDPRVAWEAGLLALGQEQYDAVVTYMDRHLELTGPRPWLHYYRAWGLLETKQFPECLDSLSQEAAFGHPSQLHLDILRVCACLPLGELDSARANLMKVLETPLSQVDMLSHSGFVRLFNRLWKAMASGGNPEDRDALIQRLLEAGLAPDEYFDQLRTQGTLTENVNFYRIRLRQPLNESWSNSHGPLPGQTDWTEYLIEWGVLATSEEEALARVGEYQARCCPLPSSVEQVDLGGEGFRDYPGVVWQGHRWTASDMPDPFSE